MLNQNHMEVFSNKAKALTKTTRELVPNDKENVGTQKGGNGVKRGN